MKKLIITILAITMPCTVIINSAHADKFKIKKRCIERAKKSSQWKNKLVSKFKDKQICSEFEAAAEATVSVGKRGGRAEGKLNLDSCKKVCAGLKSSSISDMGLESCRVRIKAKTKDINTFSEALRATQTASAKSVSSSTSSTTTDANDSDLIDATQAEKEALPEFTRFCEMECQRDIPLTCNM
jgi:hypothetical protein